MRKEIEIMIRSHAVQKTIKEKGKELWGIQRECEHDVLTEFVNYKGAHTTKCLFCGKVVDEKEECECWIYLPSLYMVLSLTDEEKYWIVQQLFIKVEKANPEMSNKEILKIVMKKISKRDYDFSVLRCKAFWGKHD